MKWLFIIFAISVCTFFGMSYAGASTADLIGMLATSWLVLMVGVLIVALEEGP